MAMMRTTTPGSLTGSLSAPSNMSAKVTVGTVNMTAADMTNYYDKEEVDGLLEGKADVEHDHIVKFGLAEVGLQNAFNMTREAINTKADKTYVDNAINTALGNIESQLDEIIGEEV